MLLSRGFSLGSFFQIAVTVTCFTQIVNAGPCDIYASGGSPCVAAHSTTRALYQNYAGPLYRVKRGSDNQTLDVKPQSVGSVADAAAQDSFCDRTTCLFTILYDQSGNGNHLTQAPRGTFSGPDINGTDCLASATGAPVTINGKKAYGVFMPPGTGYRNDAVRGTAIGDKPEGMYAVLDGKHYNGGCCFDYGNAEPSDTDTGKGHMESIYFGDRDFTSSGAGNGPWIMADLEDGLYSGLEPGKNTADPSITSRFVTAVVKGRPNHWAIRGADASVGSLSTYYEGARPNRPGYNPMSLEGAIVLGVGGDNSNSGQGTFYEGAMTATYPSDATENAVQANIAQANYAVTSMISGPPLSVGSAINFRATTACCSNKYISHDGSAVRLEVVSSSSDSSLKRRSSWTVRSGLGNDACVSFESVDTPGSYIRHATSQLRVDINDGSKIMHEDATFCPRAGLSGKGNTLTAWGYPARNFRHNKGLVYVASNGGVHSFDDPTLYNDDTSWIISSTFV